MRYLTLLLFLLVGHLVTAQNIRGRIHHSVTIGDTAQLHQLILVDYSKLVGTATRIDSDTLYFRMHAAVEESAIPANRVRYLGVFEAKKSRRFLDTEAPGFADLTWERTALPYHSRGQLKIINAVYIGAEFNLGDHFQFGGGLAPVGAFLSQRIRYSLTPKVHVGLTNQTFYFPLFGEINSDNDGVFIGDVGALITLGDDKAFLNLGGSIAYSTNLPPEEDIFLARMAIGGKLNTHWHLYGEAVVAFTNFPLNSQLDLLPSLNAAYGKRRHRWKFGIFTVFADQDTFFPPPLPYIGYSLYW